MILLLYANFNNNRPNKKSEILWNLCEICIKLWIWELRIVKNRKIYPSKVSQNQQA